MREFFGSDTFLNAIVFGPMIVTVVVLVCEWVQERRKRDR